MTGLSVRIWALASTASALLIAPPAAAQSGTAPTAATPASEAAVPADQALQTAPEQASTGLQEIVVTAQRRSENVQKSSLSIQVLGAGVLERAGTTQATDLNVLVPGIQVSTVGSTVQISIRGISDNTSNALGNPSVAFSVDGVYVGRPTSIGNNFFDVSRIEVLKGPQGTLYGRNASGGAINLITNAPSTDGDKGYFEVEGGNYSLKRVTAAFNKAFSDSFAVRVAFQDIDREGYLSDGANDQKSTAARIRALWTPSPSVTISLSGDAAKQRGLGNETVLTPRPAGQDAWVATQSPQGFAQLLAATQPALLFGLVYKGTPSQNNRFYDVSGQLDWDLGPATLTVIPAYRRTEEDYVVWNGFLYSQANKADQYTLEARLSHASQSFKWVVGGFYLDEKQNVHSSADTSILIQNEGYFYRPITKSYAGFGEATYSILPNLRAIGGVRYTSEKRTISGQVNDYSLIRGPAAGSIAELITGNKRFAATTWKAGAEFDLSPRNMLFATASTGFKAGGFNTQQNTPAVPNFYKPEKLRAYVVGLRNRFLDNRLQVNLEGFYYDYRDKQESSIGVTPAGDLAFLTNNAGKARIYGASAEVVLRATQNDTIQLYGEYNNNKYTSFTYLVPTAFFNPFSSNCLKTAGEVFTTVDCSGRPLVKAPKWVGSAAYDHKFNLANKAVVTAAVDAQFSSSLYVGTDYIPGEYSGSYAIVNGSLGYVSPGKAWSVTAFVRNVTNKAIYKNGQPEPLQAPLVGATIGDPRTFGARVRFTF